MIKVLYPYPQNGVLLRNKTGVHGAVRYAVVKTEPTLKDSKQLPRNPKKVMKWRFGAHISLLLLTAFDMLALNVGTI